MRNTPNFFAAYARTRNDGEKTMDSFVDGISNLIGFYLVLGSMLGL